MKRKPRYFLIATVVTLIVTIPMIWMGAGSGPTLFVGMFTFAGVWSLQGGKSPDPWR